MLSTKEGWQEIRNRVGASLALEEQPREWWMGRADVPSINDQIQKLYREELITEPQRDAMREHVKVWLGDGTRQDDWLDWDDIDLAAPPIPAYDTYACGLWAASAGPMGKAELAIILMTLQILCEEAA